MDRRRPSSDRGRCGKKARRAAVMAAGLLILGAAPAPAATIDFLVNPLIGAPGVDLGDGVRQVFPPAGQELFIPTFDVTSDQFRFHLSAFGVTPPLSFVNALAADLPPGGVNVVVLQDSDNDGNPATAFNAGTAANLIAAEIDEPGAGFFVYFNSALNLNRLVYSTDLSVNTADLAILARIESPTGAGAIAALPTFQAANFAAVPAPAALPLMAAGLVALGFARNRRGVTSR